MAIGGMSPQESSRGKHAHSPASCAVLQEKQGGHQKARQPEKKVTFVLNIRNVLIYKGSQLEKISHSSQNPFLKCKAS